MLNKRDNQILEAILSKRVSELAEHEIGILKARSAYLSEEEQEKFADVLGDKKTKAKSKADNKGKSKPKADKKKETKKEDKKPEGDQDAKFKKLMEDAMELGVDTKGMTTIEELEKAIDEYLASN